MKTVHSYIVSFTISVTLVGHAIVAHTPHRNVATGDNAEGNAAGLFAVLMTNPERQQSTILVLGPAAVRPRRPGSQCQSPSQRRRLSTLKEGSTTSMLCFT